jgi:hypothetical protein
MALLLKVGGGQRQVELNAATQPGAGAVARLAVNGLNIVENSENVGFAIVLAEGQGAFRLAQCQLNGAVQRLWCGDAFLHDFATQVDDAGDQALDDKAG